jgi:hypothetical protein
MPASIDLLGLTAEEVEQSHSTEVPAVQQAQTEQQATASPSRSVSRMEETHVINYPPAWSPVKNLLEGDVAASGVETNGSHLRHFTVRCEGRWRVRNAPSLNSKVVGSIANGTVVFGWDAAPPGMQLQPRQSIRPDRMLELSAEEEAQQAMVDSLNCLWVRVERMHAKEAGGVSEIKRDTASGGVMFCLRRNALGYGLYERDVEPLDGPLLLLPEDLAMDLRGDAQRANVERNEDVSLTWKLLSAAESVGRFFGANESNDAMQFTGDLKAPMKRRPEEVFEVRQREILKKAAASLGAATTKLAAGPSTEDLCAQLPKDVRGRFARLRAALASASADLPGIAESEPIETVSAEVPEGSSTELMRFAEHCSRLERSGGWPELSHEVRQEVIQFSHQHGADFDAHARRASKAIRKGTDPSSPSNTVGGNSPNRSLGAAKLEPEDLLEQSPQTQSPVRQGYPQVGFGGMCPLLPPPPPPVSGVGAARLI